VGSDGASDAEGKEGVPGDVEGGCGEEGPPTAPQAADSAAAISTMKASLFN
jgi:hypothetical protein